MKYQDLENDGLPLESRVKHLENEAGYVRDYVRTTGGYYRAAAILVVVLLSVLIIKTLFAQ